MGIGIGIPIRIRICITLGITIHSAIDHSRPAISHLIS
jgi:hypothetical protein